MVLFHFKKQFGPVAQLGERTVRIRKVKGSIPSVSTNKETSFVYQDKRGFLFSCTIYSTINLINLNLQG